MTEDEDAHAEERHTAPLEDRADTVEERALEGRVVAGKYRLERLLGRGGMGIVCAATHLGLDDRVAIKLLVGTSKESAARFLKEARLAANVKSEHVVRIFDVGTDDGTPFIVMELLEGETVAERARTPLSVEEAVDLVRQACTGVAAAHARGIVHRDLKPSNLLLVGGSVKVLDFGIAKELAGPRETGDVTSATAILGSPSYMAPEQVRLAREVDARADVWSLGVTLFELLAGRPPFQAETTAGILAAVAADPAPRIDTLRKEVPGGLARVIARCLEKDPAQRYADASALGAALDELHAAKGLSRGRVLALAAVALALGGIAIVALRPPPPDIRPAPIASVVGSIVRPEPSSSVPSAPDPSAPATLDPAPSRTVEVRRVVAPAASPTPSAMTSATAPKPTSSSSASVPGLSETQK